MAKVLVTGGCGLIGDHVCSGFLKKGYEVVAIDGQPSDYNQGKENFTYLKGSPTDKAAYADAFDRHKFDTVIHLACTVDNDIDGSLITENQIENSRRCDEFIYRYAISHDIKQFILISTTQVYLMPKTREPLREDDFVKPMTNYAKLKAESETKMAADIGRAKGMMCAILRIPPVYTKTFKDNLEAKITDPKDGTRFIYRTGEYGFHFCCVHNLVDFLLGFVRAAEDSTYNGIYNVADKNLTMASEIIEYMKSYHRLGVVMQKNPPNTSINSIKNLIGNKEMKTNYRFLDFTRILNNNMFDISKASKFCSFRWSIKNTK